MTKQTLDNEALAALLKKFEEHLVCWGSSRSLGSLIEFKMGRKWPYRLRRGEGTDIGSAALVLEGDDWVIRQGGRRIFASASVSDDDMPHLFQVFTGKKLLSIVFDPNSRECRVQFSDGLEIMMAGAANDDDLCVLNLPNGMIIGCGATSGFNSDSSFDETRAAAYAADAHSP